MKRSVFAAAVGIAALCAAAAVNSARAHECVDDAPCHELTEAEQKAQAQQEAIKAYRSKMAKEADERIRQAKQIQENR